MINRVFREQFISKDQFSHINAHKAKKGTFQSYWHNDEDRSTVLCIF